MHDYTEHSIRKALFTPCIGEVHASKEYSDVDLDWADKENLNKNVLWIQIKDGRGITAKINSLKGSFGVAV